MDAPGDRFMATLATEGPMGRSVADLAALLDVIAGAAPAVPFGRAGEGFLAALDAPAGEGGVVIEAVADQEDGRCDGGLSYFLENDVVPVRVDAAHRLPGLGLGVLPQTQHSHESAVDRGGLARLLVQVERGSSDVVPGRAFG